MEPRRNTKKLALDILGRWCSFHTWPCSRLPCSLSGAHSMVYRKDILPSPAATAATAATCPSQTSPAVQDLLSSTTLTLKGFTRFTISDSCGIHDLNQSWIQMKSLTQCPDVPSGWLKSELIHVDSDGFCCSWFSFCLFWMVNDGCGCTRGPICSQLYRFRPISRSDKNWPNFPSSKLT